jgi:hypothetical protein
MAKRMAVVIIVGAMLTGCATPTPAETPRATPPEITVEPTPTAPPTNTPLPSPTPTMPPAQEGCVRATAELLEGQNPYWYWFSGPASGCYDSLHDFLTDVGLSLYDFPPGTVITFWTQWSLDDQGAVVLATPTVNPLAWQLPPTTPVDSEKKGPRLINYLHRHDILENSGISHLEERVAQWDVIILNPDHHLSLDEIREMNPDIIILVWASLRYPHPSLSLHRGYRPSWNSKTVDGETLRFRDGNPITNLYAEDYAYVYHVLDYLEERHQLYDGVLYDCLWVGPHRGADGAGADINEDGILDNRDLDAYLSAGLLLLRETQDRFPEWLITGNPGIPWPPGAVYYQYANGNMRENALGDQFGDPSWNFMWWQYNTVEQESQEPTYHFINVDLRAYGRSYGQAASMYSLTQDDLRRMRLGLVGSMLLDSGYFGFDRGDAGHGDLWWFDEYDADLGDALGSYSENLYGPGTFSREFEKGLVILNNSDQAVEVQFDENYFDVSFDEEGTSFLIPANDARILLRLDSGGE